MPMRIAKAFYKSKTIITNAVLVCTGLAGILVDVGLDAQSGMVLVVAGGLNTVLRWVTDTPLSLLGGDAKEVP